MPHSFGKHHVVEHEDQGLVRPKSGTGVGWKRKGCWSRKLQRSPRTNDGDSGAHIQMVYDPTKDKQSVKR